MTRKFAKGENSLKTFLPELHTGHHRLLSRPVVVMRGIVTVGVSTEEKTPSEN